MADKKKPVADEGAVAARPQMGLQEEMPDYLRDVTGRAGMEDVRQGDMKVPRLAIAQKMSPEVDGDKAQYIEGLKFGELFNTLTGEVYGRVPVLVTPLKVSKQRIKFADGGGIECISQNGENGGQYCPESCAKCQFSQFGGGEDKSEPPACDDFRNFTVLVHKVGDRDLGDIPPSDRTMVVSLKSKGLKVAKTWLGLMQMRAKPIYAGVYRLEVVNEKAAKGDFYNFRVANAGWVEEGLFAELERLHLFFKDVQVDAGINKEASAGDEAVPF